MAINVLGVPNSRKTPGTAIAVIFGGPGTSPGSAPTRGLLLANIIATALTGASPSFTVAAGLKQTAGTVDETPVQVFDGNQARDYCGQGSEGHLGALAFYSAYPNGELWICPVAEASNTKANATLTFVTTALASTTLRVEIKGVRLDVSVSTGDTPTVIATNVANAILNAADLPVTAQFTLGVLTVTAKNGGPRGNAITFRAYWVNSSGLEIPIGSGATTGPATTTGAITGSGFLINGATADSIANAITNIAGQWFQRFALAHTDTTNINAMRDELEVRNAATLMEWAQAEACSLKSPSAAGTDAVAINDPMVQLAGQQNGDWLSVEIAAHVMGARLAGDASMGGSLVGEDTFPAANLNGLQLNIPRQRSSADRPTQTQIEAMLNSGVSPIVPSSVRPGLTELVASITTKCKDGSGFFFGVYKTKDVTVAHFLANLIRGRINTNYRGYNLVQDSTDGSPIDVPHAVSPSSVRDFVKDILKEQELLGIITNVDALLPQLACNINPSNPRRLDLEIPEFATPDLDIVAANMRQRS